MSLVIACLLCVVPRPSVAQVAACSTTSSVFTENFTSKTYFDPSASAQHGWGTNAVTLPAKAGAFPNASTNPNLTERIYAIVSGDFTGDGYDDVIGITDNVTCHLDLFSGAVANTLHLVGPVGACLSATAAVLVSGDVNADGLPDLVMASVNNPGQEGTIAQAQLLINAGMALGKPIFVPIDITGLLRSYDVAWHVGGSQLALKDWDGDGHDDLLVLTSAGSTSKVLLFPAIANGTAAGFVAPPVTLLPDAGLKTPIAQSGVSATGGYSCMPLLPVSRGGTVLVVADLTGDGRNDIVTGSVSENNLKYFMHNSDGTLTRQADIPFYVGAPLLGAARDMDGNGSEDLVIVRSGNDCGGMPGQVWLVFNGGQGSFTLYQNALNVGGTAQFAAFLNLDHDSSDTKDVIAGKINGLGQHAYYQNVASTAAYNLTGVAQSTTVSNLDPTKQGVVSLTVQDFTATVPSGTGLSMYVTNDGGKHWELLSAAELAGAEHAFTYFGADVRFKALLRGSSATLTGAQVPYMPAATQTPTLSKFSFKYNVVDQRRYSRSSLAYGRMGTSTVAEYMYAASFWYPGYAATLTAYDMAPLSTPISPGSTQRVDTMMPAVFDAGTLLQTRPGTGRVLYTAYPLATSRDLATSSTQLMSFSGVEATAGSTSPSLAQMMGITQLTAAQKLDLVAYLESGMGDANYAKMFDTGHSTPVFVGPPNADANYLAQNYAAFKVAHAARPPIVLLGTNDGVLHAFDAKVGTEVWGYVPYNLLAKLKTQRALNANGTAYYAHSAFVDGSIVVTDVFVGNGWHTIAVVGQAQGQGLLGNNFYFALDITNPMLPKALWEFSDTYAAPHPGCSLDNNCVTSCAPNCKTNTASCRPQCSPYDSYFLVSGATPDPTGKPAGLIEAEHFDNKFDTATPAFSWNSLPGPLNGLLPGNTSRGGFMAASGQAPLAICPGTLTSAMGNCAQMTYRFTVASAGNYCPWFRTYPTVATDITWNWGLDNSYVELATSGIAPLLYWRWTPGSSIYMSQGDHVLNVWMAQSTTKIDTVAILGQCTTPPAANMPETCQSLCQQTCSGFCFTRCFSSPSNAEWPQCGVGAAMQCCGIAGGDQYCAPVGPACGGTESIAGQTWSAPALGRIATSSGQRWVAFFGSGYNNRGGAPNVGRSIYMLDVYTGQAMGQWSVGDIPQSSSNPSTIDNTLPGSIALADVDNDGYVDRAYFGDLEGRLFKLNTSPQITAGSGGAMNPNSYKLCTLFDAGDPNQTGRRDWAPIITKPAVASLSPATANVYFGTGGDDRAPDDIMYKFYSVRDDDALGACRPMPKTEGSLSIANNEWVVGDGRSNDGGMRLLAHPADEGEAGDRYWADPVISNGSSVYFVALPGKIESVDPCLNLQGRSKVFSLAIRQFQDSSGKAYQPGQSTLPTAWVQTMSKIRTSVTLRSQAGTAANVPHGQTTSVLQGKTDVLLQNFSGNTGSDKPAIERLTDPGVYVKNKLRLLRWREVPL